ncbi:hypothetical protein C8Q77DRAFT_1154203 [Trametes polyzona]|nr:hypothetical protein C8Q77DRAFT_1154203 [Trametes polyzona]
MPEQRPKSLKDKVQALEKQLEEANASRRAAENDLQEARETIERQATALAAASTSAGGSGHSDGSPNSHTYDGNDENVGQVEDLIPRPEVEGGKRICIQAAMGIDRKAYKRIQRTIRQLVPAVGLDWRLNFRLQDAEKLGKLYRLAIKAHAVLGRYENNWATAELLKMYLQNARGHARKMGYLEPAMLG